MADAGSGCRCGSCPRCWRCPSSSSPWTSRRPICASGGDMAVLAAAIAAALLSGLALAIALLGGGEGMLASHERMSRSLRQAAEGAVQLALADLRSAPSWDAVLAAGGVA